MTETKISLRKIYNKIAIAITRFFLRIGQRKVVAKCGHKTYLKDIIIFSGKPKIIKINDKNIPYCHKCLEKMTIQCAWCGNPIFIGNRVTIHSPKETFIVPSYAVKHTTHPTGLIGCTRMSCCDMLGEMIGLWMPPGKVELTKEYKKVLKKGQSSRLFKA